MHCMETAAATPPPLKPFPCLHIIGLALIAFPSSPLIVLLLSKT